MTKKIKCPNCGFEYEKGTKFCPNCDIVNEPASHIHRAPTPEELKVAKKNQQETDEQIKQKLREKFEKEAQLKKEKEAQLARELEAKEKEAKKYEGELANQEKELEKKRQEESKDEVPAIKKVEKPIVEATVPKETSNSSEEIKPKRKLYNKKILVAALIIVLLGAGGYGIQKYQVNKEAKLVAAKKEETKKYEEVKLSLEKLYLDGKQVFLSKQITSEQIDDVEKKINQVSNKDNKKDLLLALGIIKDKYKDLTSLNGFFEKAVLTGDTLNEKGLLKETISKIGESPKEEADDFYKKYNKGLALAKSQLEQKKSAQKLVEKVYKEDKVVADSNRNTYEDAMKAVSLLPKSTLKETLEKNLAKVNATLTENEEKIVAEKQVETEKNSQHVLNETSGVNIFGEETKTRWENKLPTVQTGSLSGLDKGTVSDDPWVWAPGVQETVLNECFRRGYIIPDGYKLVQKEVKNGEGIYDLYATNTNSPLMSKNKTANTPFYLLSINCKTGWFRGSGVDSSATN